MLSAKAGAGVCIFSVKEGTSGFEAGAELHVGERGYVSGTCSSEPEAFIGLRVANGQRDPVH